jgi:hypothetical protein
VASGVLPSGKRPYSIVEADHGTLLGMRLDAAAKELRWRRCARYRKTEMDAGGCPWSGDIEKVQTAIR